VSGRAIRSSDSARRGAAQRGAMALASARRLIALDGVERSAGEWQGLGEVVERAVAHGADRPLAVAERGRHDGHDFPRNSL
jgi:hypothetical protein